MSGSNPLSGYNVDMPSTSFGIDAYKQMALNAGTDNVVASPFSIYLALLLAYAGAGGQSKSQFESALKIKGQTRDQVLQGYGSVLKQLAAGQGEDAPFRLKIANNAYVNKQFPLKSKYTNDIKKYLGVTPSAEDFGANVEAVRLKINKWAEDATENKIKEPLKSGSLAPDTALVLVNAIYFKSDWDVKFRRFMTETRSFKKLDGQKKDVDMMFRTAEFSYSDNKAVGYQFIKINHKDKQNSLMVILPAADKDFKTFEQSLTSATFREGAARATPQRVELGLPKFKFSQEYDLKKTLSKMGLPEIFTDAADFSGISNQGVKISKAVHKAFIDVNEEGTEAAAFTGMVAVPTSAMFTPPNLPKMICDRPFIFAIHNTASDALLFVGRVANF